MNAWSRHVDDFSAKRSCVADLYPSEIDVLMPMIRNGVSVLDVGCAQGGLCAVISSMIGEFSYTGLDTSEEMRTRAANRFPKQRFAANFAELDGAKFDLVTVMGVLHLEPEWQALLSAAWARTSGSLVFDLREHDAPTITGRGTIPYTVLSRREAKDAVAPMVSRATSFCSSGYSHRLDVTAPVASALCIAYRITK